MSQERNVDLVRRLYRAFSERDVESALELVDPEVEFLAPTGQRASRPGPYAGHEGIRAYFRDVERLWEELRVVPQDYRTEGDVVLVSGRVYARGAGGYLVDSPAHWVWVLRGDRVLRGQVCETREDALKVAGLDGEKER